MHPASLTSCLLLHKNFAAFWGSALCWVFSLLLPVTGGKPEVFRVLLPLSTLWSADPWLCTGKNSRVSSVESECKFYLDEGKKRPEHRFLETELGGKPRTSCRHPLFPWLQVSPGITVKEVKVHDWVDVGKLVSCVPGSVSSQDFVSKGGLFLNFVASNSVFAFWLGSVLFWSLELFPASISWMCSRIITAGI